MVFSILVALWLFAVALGFIELIRFLPKTSGIKHNQTKYLIVGFLTGFLGGISTFFPDLELMLCILSVISLSPYTAS